MERRVRGRLPELKALTETAGHSWRHLDLAPEFGRWLAAHELFDEVLDIPEELPGLLPAFADHLKAMVQAELAQCTPNELLAISGVGSLFRLASVSELTKQVATNIPGRMMLLFPGRHQAGVYRLLDAREGWNYRATPIPAADAPEG